MRSWRVERGRTPELIGLRKIVVLEYLWQPEERKRGGIERGDLDQLPAGEAQHVQRDRPELGVAGSTHIVRRGRMAVCPGGDEPELARGGGPKASAKKPATAVLPW